VRGLQERLSLAKQRATTIDDPLERAEMSSHIEGLAAAKTLLTTCFATRCATPDPRRVRAFSFAQPWKRAHEISRATTSDRTIVTPAVRHWINEGGNAMIIHAFSQFSQDERDDFAAVCQRFGRVVEEFGLVDEDNIRAVAVVGK
jgi:hypothetical protein